MHFRQLGGINMYVYRSLSTLSNYWLRRFTILYKLTYVFMLLLALALRSRPHFTMLGADLSIDVGDKNIDYDVRRLTCTDVLRSAIDSHVRLTDLLIGRGFFCRASHFIGCPYLARVGPETGD